MIEQVIYLHGPAAAADQSEIGEWLRLLPTIGKCRLCVKLQLPQYPRFFFFELVTMIAYIISHIIYHISYMQQLFMFVHVLITDDLI